MSPNLFAAFQPSMYCCQMNARKNTMKSQEGISNWIQEHLKAIRENLRTVKDDVREIKSRVTSVGAGMVSIKQDLANDYNDIIYIQLHYDKLVERVERIKRRPEQLRPLAFCKPQPSCVLGFLLLVRFCIQQTGFCRG